MCGWQQFVWSEIDYDCTNQIISPKNSSCTIKLRLKFSKTFWKLYKKRLRLICNLDIASNPNNDTIFYGFNLYKPHQSEYILCTFAVSFDYKLARWKQTRHALTSLLAIYGILDEACTIHGMKERKQKTNSKESEREREIWRESIYFLFIVIIVYLPVIISGGRASQNFNANT